MPRSSSAVPDQNPVTQSLTHAITVKADEAGRLADLLGLTQTMMPLILPMLWLGKSALPALLHSSVTDTHFAVQEAQDFFYTRPFVLDEKVVAHIRLQHEKTSTPQRLMITTAIVDAEGTEIVSLKSIIRLIEKPSDPQALSQSASKQRAMPAIDAPLPVMDQDMINRYAALSGDDNPVHLDTAYARSFGLPDTIAHGLLLLGLTQRLYSNLHGNPPESVFPLHLSCRFLLPVHAGQKTGLTRKEGHMQGRMFERVTMVSEAGPHLMAQVQYQAQGPGNSPD